MIFRGTILLQGVDRRPTERGGGTIFLNLFRLNGYYSLGAVPAAGKTGGAEQLMSHSMGDNTAETKGEKE